MRLICALVVLGAAMVSMSPYGAAERGEGIQAAGEAVEPFRVIGNIYYVGGQYGSYLITTPAAPICTHSSYRTLRNSGSTSETSGS